MMSPRLLLALIAVLCSSLPAAALANPPAVETSTQVGELFDQAQAAFAKGDKQGARAAYLKAWALQKSYDIAGNLGNVELKLGMFRDAAEHLAYGVENFPPTGEPALLRALKEKLAEAQKEVGRVTVKVDAERVKLTVNGKAAGASPLSGEVYVEAGEVVVEGELAGYVQGRALGRVKKGEAVEVVLPMMKEKSPSLGIVIGGSAVAVAALGTGIAMTLVSNAKSGDAAQQLDAIVAAGGTNACAKPTFVAQCEALDSSYRVQGNTRTVAILGFVTTGVAVGGTALAYAFWPRSPRAKEGVVRFVPAIGAHEQGLIMTGSF